MRYINLHLHYITLHLLILVLSPLVTVRVCVFTRLDYCGIIVLIVTSYIPWLHFVFYCSSLVQCVYIGGFLSLGAASICFVVRDEFRHPSYRWIRFRECSFMQFCCSWFSYVVARFSCYILSLLLPQAGSGFVRIDPLRFLARYRKRKLNQALSVSLSIGFCVCSFVLFIGATFTFCASLLIFSFSFCFLSRLNVN